MTDDDLPSFLRSTQPTRLPRAPRWRRLRTPRPEAQGWEHAELWEVEAGPALCALDKDLPAGRYRYWVLAGRRWVQLRLPRYQAIIRLPLADWERHRAKVKIK